MATKEQELNALIQQFVRILNRFNSLENADFDFGIGHKLYPSEIHAIEVIGNNEGIIARDIAEQMGITKGAISQTIAKLNRKKLIYKKHTPENSKETLLYLTENGMRAYRGHEEFHANMFKEFHIILENSSLQEFDFITSVFSRIDATLEGYQNKIK